MSTGFEREGQYGDASHPIVLRRPRRILGGGNRRRTTILSPPTVDIEAGMASTIRRCLAPIGQLPPLLISRVPVHLRLISRAFSEGQLRPAALHLQKPATRAWLGLRVVPRPFLEDAYRLDTCHAL